MKSQLKITGINVNFTLLVAGRVWAYSRGSAEEIHQAIFAGIDKCIAESEYNREGLQGIGIAVPAVVDRKEGNIVWGPDWDFLM